MKQLEIYGTFGPACADKETILQLFKEGMNGMRLNLSHTNLWECQKWIDNFHQAKAKLHLQANLLIDMKGPELRISNVTTPISIKKNSVITLPLSMFPQAFINTIERNDRILIDDGQIVLKVLNYDDNTLTCNPEVDGIIYDKKSVAIQNKSVTGNVLTENDIENLKQAHKYGITGIMQPFVRNAQDLIEIRKVLDALHLPLKIYAKIENMEGYKNIESLLPYCDHIIIARGDLGNACGLTKLPVIVHDIEEICKKHNKPFMVVTQMLHSMQEKAIPTRAEVSDIFYAVYNGASSIMLTGETASGKHPVEAMHYFVQCAKEALHYKGE